MEEALEHDNLGRPMPVWQGCRTLGEGEYFLLQPHPYSIDSRYFGPVFECQIIGVATPSVHAAVHNAFNVQRHLTSAKTHRAFRAEATKTWCKTVTTA